MINPQTGRIELKPEADGIRRLVGQLNDAIQQAHGSLEIRLDVIDTPCLGKAGRDHLSVSVKHVL